MERLSYKQPVTAVDCKQECFEALADLVFIRVRVFCYCESCSLLSRYYAAAWAPAGIFPEGGKTARTDKNDLFFGAPKAQTKIFAIFSAFRLNLRVFEASVFCMHNFAIFMRFLRLAL